MNSFSISAYEHQPMLDYYKQWLERDLYTNISLEKLDDPTFLQKLSIIQADGIRRDIGTHAAITYSSIQDASTSVVRKIQSTTNLITASLEDGFSLMNHRMVEINGNLKEGNRLLAQNNYEIRALNQNMSAALSVINYNISQATNILKYQIQQVSNVLQAILNELKIPESQRERRYHIEEGVKFFNMGMKTGDCLYFEDSLDEFSIAISIERKDFFSWYYIGMLHLYSKDHIDLEKSKSAFEHYFHYAAALSQRHELYDDALLMKAECYYLEHDFFTAFQTIKDLIPINIRASLRGMKYLSVSGVPDKQIQAVNLLKGLLIQNPYIVMQVLEDYDIMCNDYIISFLQSFRDETKKEVTEYMLMYENEMEKRLKQYPISYYQELYDELNTWKTKINCTSVIEVVKLKEELLARRVLDRIIEAEKEAQTFAAAKAYQDRVEAEAQARNKERQCLKAHGYVDLGLPSGKLWKTDTENGLYSYDTAMRIFGDKLPSSTDWMELREKCQWIWSQSLFNGGYKVIGPNGASIFLNTTMRFGGGGGRGGAYMSSTIYDYVDEYERKEKRVCRLFFGSWFIKTDGINPLCTCSVRLAY